MSDIADWTALPTTLFVVSAKTSDGIVHDVMMCSVPHALSPEMTYVRADTITALRARVAELEGEAYRLRSGLAAIANNMNTEGSPYDAALNALEEMMLSIKRQARAALEEKP